MAVFAGSLLWTGPTTAFKDDYWGSRDGLGVRSTEGYFRRPRFNSPAYGALQPSGLSVLRNPNQVIAASTPLRSLFVVVFVFQDRVL